VRGYSRGRNGWKGAKVCYSRTQHYHSLAALSQKRDTGWGKTDKLQPYFSNMNVFTGRHRKKCFTKTLWVIILDQGEENRRFWKNQFHTEGELSSLGLRTLFAARLVSGLWESHHRKKEGMTLLRYLPR